MTEHPPCLILRQHFALTQVVVQFTTSSILHHKHHLLTVLKHCEYRRDSCVMKHCSGLNDNIGMVEHRQLQDEIDGEIILLGGLG